MFSGYYVALVTPFTPGGKEIDRLALKNLVEWHLHHGTQGLLVCGSTGEGLCLTPEEHTCVVATSVEAAAGKVPVLAGASAITTHEAIQIARLSEKAGASALLAVAPPYLKPTQEGLYQHFKTLEASTDLPILLYNNPGRTGILIQNETILKLSKLKKIVGLKDSTDDLVHPLVMRSLLKKEGREDFILLSGDDVTLLAFLAQGGQGSISALANLIPALWQRLAKLWQDGKRQQALALQMQLYPLFSLVFSETSPACLKAGLAAKGLCHEDVRAPLVPLSDPARPALKQILEDLETLEKDPQFLTDQQKV